MFLFDSELEPSLIVRFLENGDPVLLLRVSMGCGGTVEDGEEVICEEDIDNPPRRVKPRPPSKAVVLKEGQVGITGASPLGRT